MASSEAGESSRDAMGGAMLYGLEQWTEVIHCPAPDRCDIAAGFVDDLLWDLSIFEEDAIRIRPAAVSSLGHRGFLFESLGPDALPAALGFQRGDLLWAVNGIKLTDFAAIGRAFEDLDQATVLTARFDRNDAEYRHTFHLVATQDLD